jgi:hypothetical protein
MADALQRDEKEDSNLHEKIRSLERSQGEQANSDLNLFDYIRNEIDERNALISQYEKNLKN